ncbi:flagellar hook-length control protein FliK [uncultured Sulfitobacter sp.]|uniref:flagellar hook-length control protein FliK n=1 Tax=uncultured Sulfitobacter sp. TaxID=191468 RepID=UPI00262BFEA2|nr:flagellar hook-length control protein FliK [uncultured Sulfitobacter sp.]
MTTPIPSGVLIGTGPQIHATPLEHNALLPNAEGSDFASLMMVALSKNDEAPTEDIEVAPQSNMLEGEVNSPPTIDDQTNNPKRLDPPIVNSGAADNRESERTRLQSNATEQVYNLSQEQLFSLAVALPAPHSLPSMGFNAPNGRLEKQPSADTPAIANQPQLLRVLRDVEAPLLPQISAKRRIVAPDAQISPLGKESTGTPNLYKTSETDVPTKMDGAAFKQATFDPVGRTTLLASLGPSISSGEPKGQHVASVASQRIAATGPAHPNQIVDTQAEAEPNPQNVKTVQTAFYPTPEAKMVNTNSQRLAAMEPILPNNIVDAQAQAEPNPQNVKTAQTAFYPTPEAKMVNTNSQRLAAIVPVLPNNIGDAQAQAELKREAAPVMLQLTAEMDVKHAAQTGQTALHSIPGPRTAGAAINRAEVVQMGSTGTVKGEEKSAMHSSEKGAGILNSESRDLFVQERHSAPISPSALSHPTSKPTNMAAVISNLGTLTSAIGKNDPAVSLLTSSDKSEVFSWEGGRMAQAAYSNMVPLRVDVAPQIARQLVEVMAQASNRPVDIALSPDELGRVRMSVRTDDGAVTVHIIAERADTLDLMRRHIDQLGQTFRTMGYESITFAFGSGAENEADPDARQSDSKSDASNHSTSATDRTEPAMINLDRSPSTGVDIRL